MLNFMLMFFVQYSYPNHVQGKVFGALVLSALAGGSCLPLIAKIKRDFELGWKVYQKVQIGIFIGYLWSMVSLILLAYNKDSSAL